MTTSLEQIREFGERFLDMAEESITQAGRAPLVGVIVREGEVNFTLFLKDVQKGAEAMAIGIAGIEADAVLVVGEAGFLRLNESGALSKEIICSEIVYMDGALILQREIISRQPAKFGQTETHEGHSSTAMEFFGDIFAQQGFNGQLRHAFEVVARHQGQDDPRYAMADKMRSMGGDIHVMVLNRLESG